MTHSNPHPLTKYRPSLTVSQIHYIISLVSKNPAIDETIDVTLSAEIKKIMIPLLAKVEVGAINPAYKLSETHAIKRFESGQRIAYESGTMSPEEEAEYEKNILGM